jgi:hypothetical protein
MFQNRKTLAHRLGKTAHVSPLRMKLKMMAEKYPVPDAECLEEWLVELANARDARIVVRPNSSLGKFVPPDSDLVSNEELIIAICQLQCLDYPQMLRLAAQLISRSAFEFKRLERLAKMERTESVLLELSNQALKVAPEHPAWTKIHTAFKNAGPLKEPLLHWTRIAEPVMKHGRVNAERWELVS